MDKLYADIGGRMRSLRQALKLTQAQVAEMAGIDASFYGQLERGANVPSVRTLLAVADALKAEPADLLPSAKDAGRAAPPYDKALIQMLEDLPEAKQRFILGMVKDIAGELKK